MNKKAFLDTVRVKHVLYDLVRLLQEAFFTQDCGQYGVIVLHDLAEAQILDLSAPQLVFHFLLEDFGLSQQQVSKTEASESSQGLEKVVIMWAQKYIFNPIWNRIEQSPELTIKQSNPLYIRDSGLTLP